MNPERYWDEKILKWEHSRYSPGKKLNPASWGVRSRMHTAVSAIHELLTAQGRLSVLDLGCGSGVICESFRSAAEINYTGFDWSQEAISLASGRGLNENFSFKKVNVNQCNTLPHSDLTIMLGFSDWVSAEQLSAILEKIPSKDLLLSYTQKKNSLVPGAYRLYRLFRDPKAYTGRTYSSGEISEILKCTGWQVHRDISQKKMRPGKLLWLKSIST